jgi:hypothetical protein
MSSVFQERPIVRARSAAVPVLAEKPSMREAIAWGIGVGMAQSATPLALRWLDAATGYTVGLAVIAFVYIGFAVADGRGRVIAVEIAVGVRFHPWPGVAARPGVRRIRHRRWPEEES